VHGAPRAVPAPAGLTIGAIPRARPESPHTPPPGETEARERMHAFLRDGMDAYADRHDRLAGGTSGLSPYLHFGCLSARELEEKATADAFTRQLAWRDFYAQVLRHHPENTRHAFQRPLDGIEWTGGEEELAAWAQGRTGYPVVDAGMRQLNATGWMHNRARLITACFLVKDLHVDWRRGEAHFMRLLTCGDVAQNNGNWQWIASVGVDPAPVGRRLYNPILQQRRHDPDGEYVRRWLPELRDVPLAKLATPWEMTAEEQAAAGCEIGREYPAPIVDHAVERERALSAYRAAHS
jgi:deoxyribodipyrimidine photo-lyase